MAEVTVTGAAGFVGTRLCEQLARAGYAVTAAVRGAGTELRNWAEVVTLGDFNENTQWTAALHTSGIIIHLAARAHQGEATDTNTRNEFQRTNVDGTRSLLRAAIRAGVQRIVFVSSCKVVGERSPLDEHGVPRILTVNTQPKPEGPYGESKLAAEKLLEEGCNEAGISLIILRPPLVYGPGVRGNLATLLGAIMRGVPLPFGSIKNQRSLIHRDHLIDAIMLALTIKLTGTHIFTLGDCILSTPDLVRSMATGLGRQARLVPCPISVLRTLGVLTRSSAAISRLTESLVVDSDAITCELGWHPRIPLESAWAEIGERYRQDHP